MERYPGALRVQGPDLLQIHDLLLSRADEKRSFESAGDGGDWERAA